MLEGLESRLALTTNFWIATGWQGNYFWHNSLNWSLGQVPSSTHDVVFDAAHSNSACYYYGGGGAIAQSISLTGGYSGSLNFYSPPVTVGTLAMGSASAAINQLTASATLSVGTWNFQAGHLNTATTTAASVVVNTSFNALAGTETRALGSSVTFGPGCLGAIDLQDGKLEIRKNNLSLDNFGQVQFASGEITARWHDGTDYQTAEGAQVRNYGTWRKTTGAVAEARYVAFLNAGNALLAVEAGKLELSEGSAAQSAPLVQTGGTTRVHAGATLDAAVFALPAGAYEIDIQGGSFETVGAGEARLDAHRVRFLNCLVELRKDDPNGFGTLRNARIDAEITFAGTAHLSVKFGENATDVDRIVADTINLVGNQLKLTGTYVSPNPIPGMTTWTFLDATALNGTWAAANVSLPMNVALDPMDHRKLKS